MTPDGRFVAYVQYEQAGGTNYSSVRLWDRQTGTNVLVSAGPDGSWPANSTSHTPALSDDGRYVTFLSDATNLVGNTVSNGLHLYRRDLQTATTVLVDVDTNGVGSQDQLGAIPFLSADGSCVAFAALDGGLIASDNNNASDVFLWDSAVGTNALISVHNPLAIFQTGNLPSSLGQLSLSADGRWAAFTSYASDLVPNDFNGDCRCFRSRSDGRQQCPGECGAGWKLRLRRALLQPGHQCRWPICHLRQRARPIWWRVTITRRPMFFAAICKPAPRILVSANSSGLQLWALI